MELATEEYNDVMVDLETLGTRPGDAVISVGAVLFDRKTKSIGPGFRANLDIEQVLAAGFQCTGGTLKFWFEQSDEARQGALADGLNMTSVLMGFAEFLTQGEGGVNETMKVWGNGAAFDNVLWREMYQRLGMQEPWRFWNDRCFRTLKNEHKHGRDLEPDFDGERHNAYADALHQAKWAINLYHNERVFAEVPAETDEDQLELPLGEGEEEAPDEPYYDEYYLGPDPELDGEEESE